jgi:hypothetical protein
VLTVTGKARVRTDFLICETPVVMAGHPNRMRKTVIWFISFVWFVSPVLRRYSAGWTNVCLAD